VQKKCQKLVKLGTFQWQTYLCTTKIGSPFKAAMFYKFLALFLFCFHMPGFKLKQKYFAKHAKICSFEWQTYFCCSKIGLSFKTTKFDKFLTFCCPLRPFSLVFWPWGTDQLDFNGTLRRNAFRVENRRPERIKFAARGTTV
jgi:hypothetical protein